MIPFQAFKTLIDIITGARARTTEEHKDFMKFYRDLVEIVPAEVAKDFGGVKVPTRVNGVLESNYSMQLNATDYLWWCSIVDQEGGRFVDGCISVQQSIWDRLTNLAPGWEMSDEQKASLLALG